MNQTQEYLPHMEGSINTSNSDQTQTSERLLQDAGKPDQPSDQGCQLEKLCSVRYANIDEMKIPHLTEPVLKLFESGDSFSQDGNRQRLTFAEGYSVEVGNKGQFSVRDASGNRVQADEIMIKPGPGVTEPQRHYAFGDLMTASISRDGQVKLQTGTGAVLVLDRRGMTSMSRDNKQLF
ncbi:MAG: hypothetical protein IPK73_17755 [Candidatus Obscuribacter sp.]|nr:hypothetical protein [Candidatus Obscuribacter sp.]MBK9278523.1 hypothetical protein [Candidatus Obscuribacter sp.]